MITTKPSHTPFSDSIDHVEPASALRVEWLSFAEEILHEVVQSYARHGALCAPTLRLVLTGSPIPAYNIQKGKIEFHLPDPTTLSGRLCWLYYQNLCGAVDFYDTQATIESYLPLIMAHEVAHHLRFHYNKLADTQWREEEIVQLMALSLIAEHPRFACLLPRLEPLTHRAIQRLAQIVQAQPQYSPKSSHKQAKLSQTTPQNLAKALTAPIPFSDILLKLGWLTPEQLTTPPTNPMNISHYWLAGMIWMLPYLKQRDLPSLSELIGRYLL